MFFRNSIMQTIIMKCMVVIMLVNTAAGARILAVLPVGARSHHAFFQPVLRTLALAGHSVTVYSPFPQPSHLNIPNYTDISLAVQQTNVTVLDGAFWNFVQSPQLKTDQTIWDVVFPVCEDAFRHEAIKKLLASDEKYELIFTQALVGQESMLVFGHKFKAPVITLQPKGTSTIDNRVFGNSLAISYIPNVGLPYSNKMSLVQRIFNAYSKLISLLDYYFFEIPRQEVLLQKYVHNMSLPPLVEMVHNVSMIFTLGHATAQYPQPSSPAIVPLGGIHVQTQRKPLPQEIKRFMDEAEHGVIYFSLGTYVPDHSFGAEYLQNYMQVFKQLPQRVLWKTRVSGFKELPDNVMIGQWMPQQDILAHPNCVLFITHGGLLSQHEAIYFGVPVVAVPYFADQPMNAKFYEEYGLGLILDFKQLTRESIYNAVTTVINDSRFKQNARKQSEIFRDRPLTPQQSAVFWTEYVIRHGASHLKPAASHLSFLQLFLIDVIVAVAFLVFVIIHICITIFTKVKYFCFMKRHKKIN